MSGPATTTVPTGLLPDTERMLIRFLQTDVAVAPLLGDRVYSVMPDPAKHSWPAARVHRWGGTADEDAAIDHPAVQVDVWGGSKRTAWVCAETIRAACRLRLRGVHEDGIVSRVVFGNLSDDPDPNFDPARPRWRFDLMLTTRPLQGGGS